MTAPIGNPRVAPYPPRSPSPGAEAYRVAATANVAERAVGLPTGPAFAPTNPSRSLAPSSRVSPVALSSGAGVLPPLPMEIWRIILGHADCASLRAFRASCRAGCSLAEALEPAQWATAVARYCLLTGEATLPKMDRTNADAHLARLRTLRIPSRRVGTMQHLHRVLPRCPNLQHIDLRGVPLTWDEVRDLNLLTLPALRTLSLCIDDAGRHGPDAACEAAFGRLTSLSLVLTSSMADNNLLALPMQALRRLQAFKLTVSHCLAVEHMQHLCPPHPDRLTHFSLTTQGGVTPEARSVLMKYLAGAPQLRTLILYQCAIDCEAMQVLATGDYPALQTLLIRGGYLGAAGTSALSALRAPNLKHLALKDDILDGTAAIQNLHLNHFRRLETLNLADTSLSDTACAALGGQAPLQVHNLLLPACSLDGDAVRALDLGRWTNLRILDLSSNMLAEQAEEAPYWDTLPHLERLLLVDCSLEDTDMAMVPWARLPALQVLDLSYNELTVQALFKLLESGLPALQVLELGHCQLHQFDITQTMPPAQMRWLWRQGAPKLDELHLDGCALTLSQLTWLHLGEIAALRRLDLADNKLGPDALHAFADLSLSHLRYLNLENALLPQTTPFIGRPLAATHVHMPRLQTLLLSYAAASQRQDLTQVPPALNVSLGAAAATAGWPVHGGGEFAAAACRIGSTTIVGCNELTDLRLCAVPDLNASRFALQAFLHLKKIEFDRNQRLTAHDVTPWAATAPRLRVVVSSLMEEGALLADAYPKLLFASISSRHANT